MAKQKHLTPKAWAELLLLGLIWGASFVSIRIALDTIPVMTSVLHRVFWAMLALWLVVWVRKLPVPRSPRIWLSLGVMGLLNNVIPFSLMAWGQLHIETGLASILNAATAIFGVITAAILFKDERLTRTRAIGVGLGFLGVAIAIGVQEFASFDIQSAAQISVIIGTISYALAGAWARVTLSDLPPVVAAAGMLSCSTVLILPVTLLVDGAPRLDLPVTTWLAIGYYALIATAGAYLLYFRVLAMAGAGNLMLVTLVIPPIAILLGAVLRDEALSQQAYLGFAVLAIGLMILNRSGARD